MQTPNQRMDQSSANQGLLTSLKESQRDIMYLLVEGHIEQSSFIPGGCIQRPLPDTAGCTELYIYCAFSYTHTPMIAFNL